MALVAAACSDASTPRPGAADAGTGGAGDDGSTEGEGPADATPPDSGSIECRLHVPFGSPKCVECTEQSCCESLVPCLADPSCKALSTCLSGCQDEPDAGGCARTCQADHAAGSALFKKLEDCIFFSPPCNFHCAVKP